MISHRTPKKNKPGEYYRYYQCGAFFNKGSNVCKSNLINADIAESEVLKRIYTIVNSNEIVKSIVKKSEKESNIDILPLQIELKNLNKELENINLKKNESLELEYESKFDINTLNQRLSFLNKKEEDIIAKINSLKFKLDNLNSQIELKPQIIKSILENFTKVFEKTDIEKKKLLLKSIIECISVTNGDNIKNRKVNQIKLYLEPEEFQALNSDKKFATTYGKVHLSLS